MRGSLDQEATEVTRPTIIVVGLGPAGAELMGTGAAHLLSTARLAYLRTRRHPAAGSFPHASSLDHHYDRADDFEEVYQGIVDELVEGARDLFARGTRQAVVYAVPGSPTLAERTVELLRSDERIDVEVIPALSFFDLVWERLGIDAVDASVRMIDALAVDTQLAGERGPFLMTQVHAPSVLSSVKLALLEGGADPSTSVVVLQRLGSDDESVNRVALEDLDRVVRPDHLTSLYIERLGAPVAAEVMRLVELARILRERCPWDKEQTHHSLVRYLIEECYELVDAIEALGEGEDEESVAHLEEELGDVLFQVVFHSTLAAEEGRFTMADVAASITDKLTVRHPHVFGDVVRSDAADVAANWEQIKMAEKGRSSVLDGLAGSLPALALASNFRRKSRDLLVRDRAVDALDRALRTAGFDLNASSGRSAEEVAGELLFGVVEILADHGVDPEGALRDHIRRLGDVVRREEERRLAR